MRFAGWVGVSVVLCWVGYAQAQTAPPSAADANPAAVQAIVAPSGLVQPSLGTVEQALEKVFVDRWKASKTLKETTTNNLGSIHRDLETTLPGLLAAADGTSGSVVGMVPVSQNLGALYDVLLRVTVVAVSAAPPEQTAALEQALTSLEGARRSFLERLESMAAMQDQRLTELRTALSARPAPAVAASVPAPCKPAAATKQKKKPANGSGN